MTELPLEDIKVLDLTHHIAGPYCTKLMAHLGAEVIKVEKPGEGDIARRVGPFPDDRPDNEKSGLFLYLNTNKKSITLNLKTQSGIKIFKQLVRNADVLVENFRPGVMSSLRLNYEILEKINQRLVMTSISNFGQTGPYKDYKAEEITLFANSGLMYNLGHQDQEPLKLGGNASQYTAGAMAFVGALAALYYSKNTGIGQYIDVSIVETLIHCHAQAIVEYEYTGRIQKRFRPMLVCPCKDGFVDIFPMQHQWPQLMDLIGMPELLKDPRFETHESRRMHSDELEAHILPWTIKRTKEEIFHATQACGVPTGYVATTEDLLKSPQYKAREFFVEIDHPVAGKLTYPGVPFRISNVSCIQNRAPMLGEHNEEIYVGTLGYSSEDLSRLSAAGII